MPGRDTLVAVEARRWGEQSETTSDPEVDASAKAIADQLRGGGATRALAAQMRRTFGRAASDVSITTNSTRALNAGAEGATVGEQVYIAPGYYDLTTIEGRERLGHEVAHVLQQRRGRDLPARLGAGERAKLEAEADHAGRAFARGERFAVQGRAPTQVALFKGAAPGKAPAATTTTIDLKAGGRIEPRPAAPDPGAGGATSSATPSNKKSKAKEQLIVTYGTVQATNPFTIERNDSGEVVKLVGNGKLSLPASKYVKQLDLEVSLAPDGYVGAKMKGSSQTTIKIGGLTVQGGTLTAAIDHGQLTYGLDGANLTLPKDIGEGSLSMQGNGDQEPAFDASLSINVPKMQPATMSFHADASGYRAEGSTGIDIKQASGNVTFGLEKVGDDKVLWSAAGTVGYNSERLSGQVSVQYNADGELSGEGTLDFKIADFLTGQATVAVDKEGHVTVNGEIRPPNETQLFPEKKIENTFFHKSVEFPIWGISIPMVGSVGIIAFIEVSLGYRVGVGAGVMRNIVLSGQYSTDPNVQPTFAITGEIFIPAFAELLVSVGGGVKLDAFIAEVGGGVKVDGRAGFYGGLSVKPTLAYEGGKYRLMGQAILAGDVGLSAQVDAFVRLHVGKWMFSWEKEWDWKLAEWNKWLGLNLGMEADLDYTLGQPLSPDIFKLKKPDSIDVQEIAKSAMPQGGMPAQGAKGAQHEHEEFKQKGGGGAGATPAASAQPKVAGTPAGAGGHKNQDPKGKTVKPTKPAKPGPAKKAKGKGPDQTGPDPKNKSKPTEPKLDATPVVEQFSMHGEPHQLLVQLGPGGHVDMASKRERLSVKVGHAVGKLIAKHASPQQISDLKAIGEVARKGDKMASTAKTHDKQGTTNAAHQIAAYGTKWEVKDLDEVAIKAPHALLVTQAVHLEKLSDALNKALGSAHTGQVIASKPGDPKEVTRQLLEKHKDAKFDFASATLTLPALHAAPLQAAHSADQLGQLLAQQTGVSKITLKQTAQKGELKLELVGAIGAATVTLGTAVVDAVPHSLAMPHPVHLDKLSEPLVKALGAAHSGQVIFQGPGDPRQATKQLLQHHADAHFDFASAKLSLPAPQPAALQGAHSIAQLGELLAQQTGVVKVTMTKTEEKDHCKLEFTGAIGVSVKLGTGVIPNAKQLDHVGETVNFTAAHHPHKLWIKVENKRPTVMVASEPVPVARQLQIMQGDRDKIADPTAKTAATGKLKPIEAWLARTDTAAAAEVSAAASATSAGSGGGSSTLVSAEHALADALREAYELLATSSEIEAPLVLKATAHDFGKLTSPLSGVIYKAGTKAVLSSTGGDPKTVAYRVRTQHPDTSGWDAPTKTLTLPPVQPTELESAKTAAELGAAVARETGVGDVRLERDKNKKFKIHASVGLETTVALGTCGPDKRVTDAVGSVASVDGYGKIIQFMYEMAQNGAVGGLSLALLRELCEIGVTFDWLKDEFRDGLTGKGGLHEWVPSNLIHEVILFVNQQQTLGGFSKASQWIKLQNEFRTDTSWIIFNPTTYSSIVTESDPASPGSAPTEMRVLAGHAGAVLKSGKSSHKFQDPFHQELRDQWVLSGTIPDCITRMQAVFRKYVWNGEDPIPATPRLHPQLTDQSGRNFNTHLAVIMRDQANRYRKILKLFLRMHDRYS